VVDGDDAVDVTPQLEDKTKFHRSGVSGLSHKRPRKLAMRPAREIAARSGERNGT
jgi:hypothetical protein